jgi:hypothetical protein
MPAYCNTRGSRTLGLLLIFFGLLAHCRGKFEQPSTVPNSM